MEFLHLVITGVTWLIIIDAISSWVVGPEQFPRTLTGTLTEPLYRPIRAILDPSRMGGLDLSPLVLIVGLQIVESLVFRAAVG